MAATKFDYIFSPKDNFVKKENVKSVCLWEMNSQNTDIFITIMLITNSRFDLFLQALDSVLNQNEVSFPWEILIMDNNPSENRILKVVESLNDSKIRYYRNEENIGHEGNINRGVQLARGEWVALLHDDDLLCSDYLTLIKQYIDVCSKRRKPLAYIRANHVLCSIKDEIHCKENRSIEPSFFIRPELWMESVLRGAGPTYVNSCGSVVNKKAFIEIGGYNDMLNPIGDAVLGLIFMHAGYNVYSTERSLGYYRQGVNDSTKKQIVLRFIEADYQLREFLYKRNILSRLWGIVFRKMQFSKSIDIKNRMLKQYSANEKPEQVSISEVAHICEYKKNHFVRGLYDCINVLFAIFYRPLKILSFFQNKILK